jgi:hypothetical protein
MEEKMQKKIDRLRVKIAGIMEKLATLEDMRPGTLSVQYQNPGEKKGAYYQVSYTHRMRSRTDYARKNHVCEIRREIANYRRAKKYFEEWIACGIELSKLKMKASKRGKLQA